MPSFNGRKQGEAGNGYFRHVHGRRRAQPSDLEEQTLAEHPALCRPQAAAHIVFASLPPGTFLDWHPAPRRQYVILLSGQIEIGLGDGSSRRFEPGDARLVEDTTGQGHTTRYIGPGPVITAVIPLAQEGATR